MCLFCSGISFQLHFSRQSCSESYCLGAGEGAAETQRHSGLRSGWSPARPSGSGGRGPSTCSAQPMFSFVKETPLQREGRELPSS